MIRSIISTALIAAAASLTAAQAEPALHTLTVNVSDLTAGEGVLYVGLADSEAGYRSFQFVNSGKQEVTDAQAVMTFTVPAGDYAMHVFQDLNGDGRPNFSPEGAPLEPVGASNNAEIMYGPAQWPSAAFKVNGDVEQKVAMTRFGS